MTTKIKSLNLRGCQHLKKIVIGDGVEFSGKIDLTDTPIKVKNDIAKIPDAKFKNIPEGISLPWTDKDRAKLAVKTFEIGTQTEPMEITPLETLNLTRGDREVIEYLRDIAFWYEWIKDDKKINYLKTRHAELKERLSKVNPNVRLVAEHVLLINEKIIETFKYLNFFEKINSALAGSWEMFLEQVKKDKDIFSQTNQERYSFISSATASVHKNVDSKNPQILFPTFIDGKTFKEYFDNSKTWCGVIGNNQKISNDTYNKLEKLFKESLLD